MTLENNVKNFVDSASTVLNLKGSKLFKVKDVLTTYAAAFGDTGKYKNCTDDGIMLEILSDETNDNKSTYYKSSVADNVTTWSKVGVENPLTEIPVAGTSIGGFKLSESASTLAKTNIELQNEEACINLKNVLGDVNGIDLVETFDSVYNKTE